MPFVPFLADLGPQELVDLIGISSLFGKLILLTLLLLSIMSWAVMIEKARNFARIRDGHIKFWNALDSWLDGRVAPERFVAWCESRPHLPLCNLALETVALDNAPAVRRAAERVAYAEVEKLEKYLMLISTTVTVSPFLGLLGTVWGIMSSFWNMTKLQSANLTVVAPGIAEALITTVAGLAVAIPAVVFYNSLVRKVDLVGNELDRLRTVMEEQAGGGRGAIEGQRDVAQRPGIHDKERI